MSAKSAVVFLAQALLIQTALSQCTSRAAVAAGPGLSGPYGIAGSYDGLANGLAGYGFAYNGLGGNGFGCNGLGGFAGNNPAYDGCYGNGLGYNGLALNNLYAPAIEIAPTSGGALSVTSASSIAPNSVVVASENVYEGALEVLGELPFVGTVGLEGVVPSAGAGAVNHACGNGATGMLSQNGATVSAAPSLGAGFAPVSGFGLGNVYGQGIGAFGNAGAIAPAAAFSGAVPFGYGVGFAGLGNSAAGLASAYPGAGFGGAYPAAGFGAGLAAYGGAGEGNVAVAGELPVAGNTAVAGQVPVMGAVSFGGAVPAAGTVTISGNCACGCGSPYVY